MKILMELEKQISRVLSKLVELKRKDEACRVFGSDIHRYVLNPPLTEQQTAIFETLHGIRLPEDYRLFLTRVGDGGAGPFYGLTPLGNTVYLDPDYPTEDAKINPSAPFLHTTAWNMEFEEDLSEEEYGQKEDEYFQTSHSNGLLRICNYGCGIFINLVVNGQEYGNMWTDDRCNSGGIYPSAELGNTSRTGFLDWYELWLDKSLEEIKEQGVQKKW